jgi:hypothetical protein
VSELTSTAAQQESIRQHQTDPFLLLLTITHSIIPEGSIYIVANNESIVSRGNTYIAYPFEIELPTDGEEAPTCKISIGNVDRRIGAVIEMLKDPPTVTIEVVLASTPDDVERAWSNFSLTDVTWDAMRMSGTIRQIAMHEEPWPGVIVAPNNFPGLFP